MMASSETDTVNVPVNVEHMIFPNMPLTYEEMLTLVPEGIRRPGEKRHRAVYGLIQAVARQLEDARVVSAIPPGQYLKGDKKEQSDVQTQFRIRGIQQEMSAVRFRLEIHDYRGAAEEKVLEDRMLELYEYAKRLDPHGVARFERTVDKKMKRVRIKRNGYHGRNETGGNERIRAIAAEYKPFWDGEPDRIYRCQ